MYLNYNFVREPWECQCSTAPSPHQKKKKRNWGQKRKSNLSKPKYLTYHAIDTQWARQLCTLQPSSPHMDIDP